MWKKQDEERRVAKPISVRAIAFDVNGTLLDDTHVFVETINRMFEALGLSRWPEKKIRREFGQPWTRIFRERGIGPEAKSPHELYELYNRIYLSFPPAKLAPGAENTLIKLRGPGSRIQSCGFRLIIVSAQQLEVTQRALGRLMKVFDGEYSVHGAGDKLKVLQGLKKEFGEVLYVGDQVDDIRKAHEAGIKAAAYTHGLHFEDMLAVQNPDLWVRHFADLFKGCRLSRD